MWLYSGSECWPHGRLYQQLLRVSYTAVPQCSEHISLEAHVEPPRPGVEIWLAIGMKTGIVSRSERLAAFQAVVW